MCHGIAVSIMATVMMRPLFKFLSQMNLLTDLLTLTIDDGLHLLCVTVLSIYNVCLAKCIFFVVYHLAKATSPSHRILVLLHHYA